MRRDMEEVRERREAEHLNLTSSEGLELVPLMKNQVTHFVCLFTSLVSR